jgi:hypothetical protein
MVNFLLISGRREGISFMNGIKHSFRALWPLIHGEGPRAQNDEKNELVIHYFLATTAGLTMHCAIVTTSTGCGA